MGLCQDYWDPRLLLQIARGVGLPLRIDKATVDRTYGSFARVLIEVDLSSQPPELSFG